MSRSSTIPKPRGIAGAPTTAPVAVKKVAGKAPVSVMGSTPKVNTVNASGGSAFKMTDRIDLSSTSRTFMLGGPKNPEQFYLSSNQRLRRLEELVKKDPFYAAKDCIILRHEDGLRTVSHAMAAMIAHHAKGAPWLRDFFFAIVKRADDMSEIASAYREIYKINYIPNAMKRGFAEAFGKFDEYALAKYQLKDKDPSLADVMNLVHPVPNDLNRLALYNLAHDQLRNEDTWEARLSVAGQDGTSKADVWKELVEKNELGIFAILRNLRNLMDNVDETTMKQALSVLTDGEQVRKSLILPFDFLTAHKVITAEKFGHKYQKMVLDAISMAVELACANVKPFKGRTAIVVDESGSMQNGVNQTGDSPAIAAAMFASILVKVNPGAEIVLFSDNARYFPVQPTQTVMDISGYITRNYRSAGTNHVAAVQALNKAYDTIIWLSDEQGWGMGSGSGNSTSAALGTYCTKFNAKPSVFSWNLNNIDGTMQFHPNSVVTLAGWSFRVFDLIARIQNGGEFMTQEIDKLSIPQYAANQREIIAKRIAKLKKLPVEVPVVAARKVVKKAVKAKKKTTKKSSK